jgi:hypothetical protein
VYGGEHDQAGFEPVWIRIDLPLEALVKRVVLAGIQRAWGKAIPTPRLLRQTVDSVANMR